MMYPAVFVLGLVVYLFIFKVFRWSVDAETIRKIWVPLTLSSGLLLSVVFYHLNGGTDNSSQSLAMAGGVMTLAIILCVTTRFCKNCSMMEVRKRRWVDENSHCKRCGTKF